MSESCIRTDLQPGQVLMKMDWELLDATVVERPNRFVVVADLNGKEVKCHLHDPGRLRELIFSGNRIRIREKSGPKTNFSVVCALDHGEWVIIDSRFHPVLARNFLPEDVKAEVGVEGRRIDFMYGNEYIEVKGCTLLENGTAKFPDAPSIRATGHVRLLTRLRNNGFVSSILVLVIREGADCFLPNRETDPEFTDSFKEAVNSGVNLFIMKMHLEGKAIVYDNRISLCGGDVPDC